MFKGTGRQCADALDGDVLIIMIKLQRLYGRDRFRQMVATFAYAAIGDTASSMQVGAKMAGDMPTEQFKELVRKNLG